MKHRLLIVIWAALAMMGALSIDAYLPALPAIAHDYGVSSAAVQQTLTVYIFCFGFMMLFYGMLSDSFGRRPVILFSLTGYLFSSAGAAWSPSLGWLLFFRALQGLSAGGGWVVGQAMVVDMFSGAEARRILSWIWVVFGVAPALAPIIGGWLLAWFGWKSIFYFITLFTLVLLTACIIHIPESLVPEKRHAFRFGVIVRNYLHVGSNTKFMFGSLALAFSYVGTMIYVAAAPAYILNLLHLTVKDFSWLFVTFISGMTLGSFIAGRYAHTVKPSITIATGFGLIFAASLYSVVYTAFFPVRVPWAVIPHFFNGLGVCLAAPAMTVFTLELFPTIKGLPSSLQNFVFMMIFSLLSGVVAPLTFDSAFHLAVTAAIGVSASAVLWWIAARDFKDHPVLTPEEEQLAQDTPHF
jgi:DHA1 family bicyclomycin/chloramphenicol resistance-like MFS transporter